MIENIHILDTDKATWIPMKVVESPPKINFEEPEITKPLSFSCSIQMKQNKAMRKWYRDMTRTMPDRANPHKKRAWRLIRKWFNRYQRPRCKGMNYRIETEAGYIDAVILDVTIHKDRNNRVYLQYKSRPILP